MHKIVVGTDGPHAQIKFLKQEIKQKHHTVDFTEKTGAATPKSNIYK